MNALLDSETLAEMLAGGDARLRVFDVAVFLRPDPPSYRVESGRPQYADAHIPGAAFLDLARDLSDTTSRFAFTLPSPDALTRAWRAAGIDNDSRVVFYSSGHVMWATRAWWMLSSCGHPAVAVLDGGLAAWQAAGHDTVPGEEHYPPGEMDVRFEARRWADRDEVLAAVGAGDVCTLNALPPAVYEGSAAVSYGRPGHIAGSYSLPYDELLDHGRFRPVEELSASLAAKTAGRPRVITYCGGGISATIDAFALTLIGHDDVAVYDGSMSEWASDATLPVNEGSEP